MPGLQELSRPCSITTRERVYLPLDDEQNPPSSVRMEEPLPIGASVSGVGAFTLEVDGAVPNSATFMLFQSQQTLFATETTYRFPGFLLHSRLVPGQIRRIPFLLPTDGSDHAELSFYNPGNLNGLSARYGVAHQPAFFHPRVPQHVGTRRVRARLLRHF